MWFDFDVPYKMYPRKEGKSVGMKRLCRTVKTQEDYDRLLKAVTNYIKLIDLEGRDLKYIKLWSTFCSQWEDYAELELPSGPKEIDWS